MNLFATSYKNYYTAPRISGVYTITNNKNGKVYIGESVNMGNRISTHIGDLLCNKHCNTGLQKDFNQYGIQNFSFNIIKVIDNVSIKNNDGINTLLYLESAYYRKYEKQYQFYNIVIPYEEIDQKKINMTNYTIDYDKVKTMIDNDPYDIKYKKIEWTPVKPKLTINDILKRNSNCDLDEFYTVLSDENYKIISNFMFTEKYRNCLCWNKRTLLCVLHELKKIKILKREKNFKYIQVNKRDYIYQDSKYIHNNYINCQKPITVSYQAQKDIIKYLNSLNDDMKNQMNNTFKNFQEKQIKKYSQIEQENFKEGFVPHELELLFGD